MAGWGDWTELSGLYPVDGCAGCRPRLKAITTHVTSSEFRSVMYPGGAFNLEIFMQWMQITHSIGGSMLQMRDIVINYLGGLNRIGHSIQATLVPRIIEQMLPLEDVLIRRTSTGILC